MNTNTAGGIKKITLDKIGCNKKFLKEAAHAGNCHVARIYGKATEKNEDSTKFGKFWNFTGIFHAINVGTGEIFGSRRLILPELAQNELADALDAAKKSAKKGSDIQVEFGFDISVIPSDREDSVGYEFSSKPIVSQAVNPLAELDKAMLGDLKTGFAKQLTE